MTKLPTPHVIKRNLNCLNREEDQPQRFIKKRPTKTAMRAATPTILEVTPYYPNASLNMTRCASLVPSTIV